MISNGGEWKILNKENLYHGDLQIDDSSGSVQLVIYHFSEKIDSRLNKEQLSLICGRLNSGADVSLVRCSILSHSENLSTKKTTYVILAEYAFFGVRADNIEGLKINRIKFQVQNAVQWGRLSDFKSNLGNEKSFSYSWNIKEDLILNIDDDFSLRLFPDITDTKFKEIEEIKLYQTLMCEITSKDYFDINNFQIQIKKILDLVTFCTGKSITVSNIKHYIIYNGFDFEADLLISKIRKSNLVETRNIRDEYISLDDLTINEKRPISNWFLMYVKLEPIIDLFCLSIYYPQMPVELHFINIMSALESYHERFVCSNIKDYNNHVFEILSGCAKPVYDENFAILTKDLSPKSKKINLFHRIADLLLANFEINFIFPVKFVSRQSFINTLVNTRNYYTHYDYRKRDRIFSAEEMAYLVPFLRTLLIYHLTKMLEIDPDKVRNFSQNRLRQLNIRYEIDNI
jgi:hypothetical protein